MVVSGKEKYTKYCFIYITTFIQLLDPDKHVLPTMGFRIIRLKYKSYTIKIYDLGGSIQIRSLWPKYYNDVSSNWVTLIYIQI